MSDKKRRKKRRSKTPDPKSKNKVVKKTVTQGGISLRQLTSKKSSSFNHSSPSKTKSQSKRKIGNKRSKSPRIKVDPPNSGRDQSKKKKKKNNDLPKIKVGRSGGYMKSKKVEKDREISEFEQNSGFLDIPGAKKKRNKKMMMNLKVQTHPSISITLTTPTPVSPSKPRNVYKLVGTNENDENN